MLDYEILGYFVEYQPKDDTMWYYFDTCSEERAVEFIEENRDLWRAFRLIKKQVGIFYAENT